MTKKIEKLMQMGEKRIYKIYTIAMFLLITFQIIVLLWSRGIFAGIGLGFNIGLWSGYSLVRLFTQR